LTIAAVPSGEPSSMTSISKGSGSEKTLSIIAEMFSFSL
jgi:hypothetical protein